MRIVEDVQGQDSYFIQKANALGKPELRPIQKVTSAVRMLAYGGASDLNDEYLRLGESTSNKQSQAATCNWE
ncbi:uncharacterized protein PGTG_20897 [Puccinia graminis f. sp. tritici CRL 75-36-700-3]|uniref:Uncharacterized protein n=1 Tax=Puccinia graminis f. sp. tritici (strain CRL 75-36-700-3 / race SCCL) TaxID=418459 RepID=H6QPH9_PUCGT|nr:uncharacterized protein PGTG_20897 [Puccinia graminis f. sp. tritici CRL 75-36-700-3]EHS63917.1 hypothetical protein PGTG_20897 [Puccinia graminis f. sp. tritici CRL 75-36-700-3]